MFIIGSGGVWINSMAGLFVLKASYESEEAYDLPFYPSLGSMGY